MAKFDGSQVAFGVGLEATRGTAASIAYWFPWTDLTFKDMVTYDDDVAVRGVTADAVSSAVVKEWAEGNGGGQVFANGIGYLLYNLFGAVSTASDTGAHIHTFSLDVDSNSHKSLTVGLAEPNAEYRYALCMIESIEITIEPNKRVMYTVNLKGKKKVSASLTPAYATDYGFFSQHASFKVAADKSSLSGATARCIQKLTLKFTKKLEEIPCVSQTEFTELLYTSFAIEGTLEAIYDNETDYKNDALAGSTKALGIYIQDTSTTIGADENPGLDVLLNQVHFNDYSPTYNRGDIVKQTVSFKSTYKLAETEMVEAILTNTTSSY